MFYQLNKGEDYDVNGTNLKTWLSTYKTNLTNLVLEDTGKATVTNLTTLCYTFKNLQSVDLSSFNGNNVTECYRMFENCINLVNITGLNLPNCNNYRAMFSTCTNLTYFPIKPKNFKDDTVYRWMYGKCANITEDICNINISNCECNNAFMQVASSDISNITLNNCITTGIFNGMTNVKSISDINIVNCKGSSSGNEGLFYFTYSASNRPSSSVVTVTNINIINSSFSEIFKSSYNLTSINNLYTENITSLWYSFGYCRKLVNIPNFDTSMVTQMFATFTNCNNLVDVPQFNTNQVANITNAFAGCNNLSNASIQNIINMCLNSNVPSSQRNLYTNNSQASPFYNTKFDNSYYQNRWAELTAKGWTY